MRFWGWVLSASDRLKQSTPDLTAVKNIYRNTCKAVKVDGTDKLRGYLPGPEGQDKIKRIATDVAVPELLRYTGIRGAVQIYRIVWGDPSSSVELNKVVKKCEELQKEVEILKHDNKILSEQCKRLESQSQDKPIHGPSIMMDSEMTGFKGLDHVIDPKPEDGYPEEP